jgi:putative ABC transport system permease protein
LKDAETLERVLPGLRKLAPLTVGNDTVSFRDRRRQVAVLGSTSNLLEVRNLSLSTGEFLPAGPMDRGAPVVVIGSTVADELYAGDNPLGTVMRIGDNRMRVIGVLAPRGMHMGIDMNEVVIVPVATAMHMFNRSSLFRILLKMNAFGDVDAACRRTIEILKERHNGEEDITCWTQDSVMSSLSAILTVLTYALAGIAAISLAVAGVGIMNVMLVSVSERTREIGLLKSLGARNVQIRGLFLAEAVILSTSGGAVGLAIGSISVAVFDEIFPSFPASPPQWAVLAAIGVSVGVGAIFGLLPAWKATRLDPVTALARR